VDVVTGGDIFRTPYGGTTTYLRVSKVRRLLPVILQRRRHEHGPQLRPITDTEIGLFTNRDAWDGEPVEPITDPFNLRVPEPSARLLVALALGSISLVR